MIPQPSKVPSSVPTSIWAQMVAPKAPVLLRSRTPRTHETPSTNSTAMTGKAACWRSVRTGLLVHPVVVVTKVVADLEVAWDVEGFEAVLVVLEVALEEAMADVVATEVEEVAMVVRLLAASMTLLLQALPPRHRTPLPTTLHLEEKSVSSYMFETYVFIPTPISLTILLTVTAAMVHQQRRSGRTFHDYRESRACRDTV